MLLLLLSVQNDKAYLLLSSLLPQKLQIKNLPEALHDPSVCSIYRADLAQKTQELLRTFSRGNALFTLPQAPIKCSGAAQKICYLADEMFRKVIFSESNFIHSSFCQNELVLLRPGDKFKSLGYKCCCSSCRFHSVILLWSRV